MSRLAAIGASLALVLSLRLGPALAGADSGTPVPSATPPSAGAETPIDLSAISNATIPGSQYGLGEALAINRQGQIAGYASTLPGEGHHAVRWDNGVMTDLGTLPGTTESQATAINDAGQVAGYSVDDDANSRAMLWEHGSLTDLGTLGGQWSEAYAINDAGQIVGAAETKPMPEVIAGTPEPRIHADVHHAALWKDGAITDLGVLPGGSESEADAINAAGRIVGWSDDKFGNHHAVMWDHGAMTDLGARSGGVQNEAAAINTAGQIAGWFDAQGEHHAALWDHGVMADLGVLPGGVLSDATAIDDAGQVVGGSSFTTWQETGAHAFLWSHGVMVDLSATQGTSESRALGITATGQIVGWAKTIVDSRVVDTLAALWEISPASVDNAST